jgi:hypothetical protein
MAIIQTPQPGQPLDLGYIATMAKAINDLSSEVSVSQSKYLTIDTQDNGQQSIRTSDARIIGGYAEVANNSTVDPGEERTFTYSFPSDFQYPPIVTATLVSFRDTPAGRDPSVIITSITNSAVRGKVRFNTDGNAFVGVNLVIIGIPQISNG